MVEILNPMASGGILALRAHCALLLDYVPPEESPGTPLGNALRGNVCPARARRTLGARPARYLSINYPDFSPRFTL